MNLVLFEPGELEMPLSLADPRAQHILKVLRRAPGDTFVAGVVNGPHGVATLLAHDTAAGALTIAFAPTHEPPPLPPVTLLVGLPRPQTARDLLRDATTLGVARIHFVATERADPNYAASSLWTSGEWRRHVLAGATQACDTRLPEITWTHTLASALAALPSGASSRLALDNYEATAPLASALSGQIINHPSSIINPTVLALGPERGWDAADRAALRAAGFTLCSLGSRVLRLETAVVAALAIV
ncbi:MAG: RNA methyltransferase, partial [Burkholderiales bacterium]|nr:RNA methyltransferase [Opitutaceae bacterium]